MKLNKRNSRYNFWNSFFIDLKIKKKLTNLYLWKGWSIHKTDELCWKCKVYSIPLINQTSTMAPSLTALSGIWKKMFFTFISRSFFCHVKYSSLTCSNFPFIYPLALFTKKLSINHPSLNSTHHIRHLTSVHSRVAGEGNT